MIKLLHPIRKPLSEEKWKKRTYSSQEYGRGGHDMPVAQSTNYSLEPHSSDDDSAPDLAHTSPDDGSHAATSGFWQDTQFDDLDFSADYNLLHSQAGARNAVDDPGGSVDDPGGGNIDDKDSFCDPSTSTSTSPTRPLHRLLLLL